MTIKDPAALALAAALLLGGCATPHAQLFVSPAGRDDNPGTRQRPFATLPRAQQAARALRQAQRTPAPVTVFLRGGTYVLREPLAFTPEDSGAPGAPVTYAAYRDEQPVLSGGRRLAGAWEPVPGKPYWQLAVPEAQGRKWAFNSLFVNGESRLRARTPNWGDKVLRAEGREPGGDPRQALRYLPGDVDPAWCTPTDIDAVLLCSWTPTIHRLKAIVPERRALRFFSAHTRSVDFWERNFRYYLSNVFEALDQPGEWYLNRDTGTLYYYPMPGEDLASAEVVAPLMSSRMVVLAGDPEAGKTIEHLHFRGLAFRHLDGDLDKHNGAYRQGHMYLAAAVAAKGLRHASFERCTFSQLGEYALELADGCRDVAVRQCHFFDLGAGAIQLGVTDLGTLLGKEKPVSDLTANPRYATDLVVDNCCIHRLGTVWHGCYGIVNRFSSRTRITHNEIFDVHWDAIGLDARWDWKGVAYCYGAEVAYNHLHHLGLRYQTDAAGVYQFGPLDTHIHHNLIHDTAAYPYICGYAGIYLDEQSRGARVENNLVYNADWYAYFQHKGTDNLFRNNIGAFARDGLLLRGGLNELWKTNYMEACRNVYVASNALAIKGDWQGGLRPPLVHSNLYHTLAAGAALTFGGKPFAEWQAAGRDASSVIADPGFRDPAAHDFTLAPDAPACRLIGFTPFGAELAKAGLYGDAAWRALPSRFARRAPTAVWSEADFSRLNSFSVDPNLLGEGEAPDVFRQSEQKGAGFAVTSEVPGTRGPKCVVCRDKKGLAKSFYPYIHVAPRALTSGRITATFSARLPEADAAAPFSVELRGASTSDAGPSISVSRDGAVRANGKPVATLQPGRWATFRIAFSLGPQRSKSYALTVSAEGRETSHAIPFASPSFDRVSWFGITASADADGRFYLDDLALSVEP